MKGEYDLMHFILLEKTHVRVEAISAFRWGDGILSVFFIGEENPAQWDDPKMEKYNYLCDRIRDIVVTQR